MTRRRKRSSSEAKATILTGAVALTGIFEFFDNLDEGDNVLLAAGKALKSSMENAQLIAEAVKKRLADKKGK